MRLKPTSIIMVVVVMSFGSGCAKESADDYRKQMSNHLAMLSTMQFNESLKTFNKDAKIETISEIFKWCFGNPSMEVGDYCDETESVTINNIQIRLFEVIEATRKYEKWLLENPDHRDFETLAALEGMVVLGKILESQENSFPSLTGLMLQQKALLILAEFTELQGYADLHKVLLQATAALDERLAQYKAKRLRKFR